MTWFIHLGVSDIMLIIKIEWETTVETFLEGRNLWRKRKRKTCRTSSPSQWADLASVTSQTKASNNLSPFANSAVFTYTRTFSQHSSRRLSPPNTLTFANSTISNRSQLKKPAKIASTSSRVPSLNLSTTGLTSLSHSGNVDMSCLERHLRKWKANQKNALFVKSHILSRMSSTWISKGMSLPTKEASSLNNGKKMIGPRIRIFKTWESPKRKSKWKAT